MRLFQRLVKRGQRTDSDSDVDVSFVTDDRLRALLEDYWRQAIAGYEAKAYLGTLATCGGIVEGLLAWALVTTGTEATARYPDKPVPEWDITRSIKVASDIGLVGKTANDASWAVKEFRNFIHPYNLLRSQKSARADEALAGSALSAVREICRSLRGRLQIGTRT